VLFKCPDGYSVERLTRTHDRKVFCCGETQLDRYIREQASQDAEKSISATHVLTLSDDPVVIAYCTLASAQIVLEQLPSKIAQKLTKQPLVPATLLARLAVDKNHKGKKFGELLLMYALYTSLQLSSDIGTCAVVVDPKYGSVNFYAKFGFIALVDSTRMFLPMETIKKMGKPSESYGPGLI